MRIQSLVYELHFQHKLYSSAKLEIGYWCRNRINWAVLARETDVITRVRLQHVELEPAKHFNHEYTLIFFSQ